MKWSTKKVQSKQRSEYGASLIQIDSLVPGDVVLHNGGLNQVLSITPVQRLGYLVSTDEGHFYVSAGEFVAIRVYVR